MLDGWYCRSFANQNASGDNDNDEDHEPNVVDDSDESQDIPVAHLMPRVDYKSQYTSLKKKMKFLLYVSFDAHIHFKSIQFIVVSKI